jgi:hypothetical protein
MRKWIFIAAAACCTLDASAQVTQPQLQSELLTLRQQDQDALGAKRLPPDQLRALQQAHTRRLKEIVAEYGWPTLSMVGNDASQGAWLLAQHADDDPAWQRAALDKMEKLIPDNEVRKADVAYLRDRLDVAEHKPQRYGTQGHCAARGKWEPFALAEPEQVDARRQAMDLAPLGVYIDKASNVLCRNYKAD